MKWEHSPESCTKHTHFKGLKMIILDNPYVCHLTNNIAIQAQKRKKTLLGGCFICTLDKTRGFPSLNCQDIPSYIVMMTQEQNVSIATNEKNRRDFYRH